MADMSSLSPTVEHKLKDGVIKGGPSECWEWSGYTQKGYGYIYEGSRSNRRAYRAHRVAFALANPSVVLRPEDYICHSCDNRRCCNPAHLWLGTEEDNKADMYRKQRHAYGERHSDAKVPESALALIRRDHRTKVWADKFGVGRTAIQRIRKYQTRRLG